MKFSDEYKAELRQYDPDNEALARMKAAVMAKTNAPEKPRNAMPLTKRIAIFGGSAAACAIIAICAVKLTPIVSNGTKLAADSVISFAEVTADNGAGGSSGGNSDLSMAAENAPAYEADEYDEMAEDGGAFDLESDSPDSAPGHGFAPEFSKDAAATSVPNADSCGEVPVNDNSSASTDDAEVYSEEVAFEDETECATGEPEDFTECSTGEITCETDECEDETVDESLLNDGGVNAEMFGSGYFSTIIEISADGETVWVYGDAQHNSKMRFARISTQEEGADSLPCEELLNITDGEIYLVRLEKGRPNCIYVTDSSGTLWGKYRRNG